MTGPSEITAELNYTVDTGIKPVNETYGPNERFTRNVGTIEPRTVPIRNGRLVRDQLSLDRNGFVLVDHETHVPDFFDLPRLPETYYPEVEALLLRMSGARRVVVFDATVRSSDDAEREAHQVREPVPLIHNDYTERSGPQRVREILPDEADALLAHPFAIIQVWRPIAHPVQRNPLAVADSRTLSPSELIAAERRYPYRIGEIYRLSYSPAHAWFYFPGMHRNEAIVFKVYDSQTDGRARFTPHTSFEDPTTPPDAPSRQSIEARAFAFFGP